jgi:hypothetical protein
MSETLAAGATDQNDLIASFSSRGPGCGGVTKPDVSAPGVNVRTSDISVGYIVTSGTSWSTAHAAGAAAMIVSANPLLGIDEIAGILETTSVCIDNNGQCGQATCPEPNNVYGHGRIDVYEAVWVALGTPPPHGELSWLTENPLSGTLSAGEMISVEVTYDTTGLEAGIYAGAMVIASNDPADPYISVPVSLDVTEPCDPVNVNEVGYTPSFPKVGEPVTFTALATGTPPITYAWNFGDGLVGEGEVVTHIYTWPDIYQPDLIANNACGTHHVIFIVTVEPLRTWLALINR